MSSTRNIASVASVAFPVNTTNYAALGGNLGSKGTTETSEQITYRSPGTLSSLYVLVVTNANTATSTFRTRKNTANGNQSVSVGSTVTGVFEDLVNTDTVVAGDLLNYQGVTGATGSNLLVSQLGIIFTATTSTVKKMVCTNTGVLSTASATLFSPLQGVDSVSATEANNQYKSRVAGTVKNLQVHISANSRTTATTFNSRKNTANGTLTVSVGSAATGFFEDTTHTDNIVATDLINYASTTGTGAGTISFNNIAAEITTTNGSFVFLKGSSSIGLAAGATTWQVVDGAVSNTTPESSAQNIPRMAFTAANLQIFSVANSTTTASTMVLRQNTANSTLSISITAATTGIFEDIIDTVAILATDNIDYQITAGATGPLNYTLIGMTGTVTAPLATNTGTTLLMMGV